MKKISPRPNMAEKKSKKAIKPSRHPETAGSNGSTRTRSKGKKSISAEEAHIAANVFILFNYPTLYTGCTPRFIIFETKNCWIVPIVLTSPGYGIVGEAGMVAVDARTGKILGSTPRSDVVEEGKRLKDSKRDEIQAAFLQARVR